MPWPRRSAIALVAALAVLPAAAFAEAPGAPATPAGVGPAGWDVAPLRHIDQARARAELGRILASEELRAGAAPRGAATVLAAAWVRLQAVIARQPAAVTRGVVVACLLVLLLVGAHVAWSMRSVLRGDRRRSGPGPAPEERRSPDEARADAASAAAAGDYAGAVRLLYLAALRALQRAGVCDLAAGTADWTVVARCRSAPGVEAPLRGLVSRFQESRFGGHAIGREQYDECAAHLDAILRLQAAPGGAATGEAA
jgi:hypothetical protein